MYCVVTKSFSVFMESLCYNRKYQDIRSFMRRHISFTRLRGIIFRAKRRSQATASIISMTLLSITTFTKALLMDMVMNWKI